MALLRLSAILVAVGGVAYGCSGAGSPGGGDDDDMGDDVYELEWTDPTGLAIGFGEYVEIGVVYRDPWGEPASDTVSFALVGQAQDASLDALELQTDADGTAFVGLHGSSVAASFRVRATAPLATEIHLDVSVSDAGFGAIELQARYEGSRGVDERGARVFSGRTCVDLDPFGLPPDDRSLPLPPGEDTVLFPNLAVGPTYAVAVTGSTDGTLVAFGCTDEVRVGDGETTPVEVVVDDLLPSPVGEFAVRSSLDLADAVEGRPATWLQSTRDLLAGDGGAAAYLLARIGDYIAARIDADAAARFETAVEDGSALGDLEAALVDARDLELFLDDVAMDLEAALLEPIVRSTLMIDPAETDYEGFHEIDRVEVDGEALGLDGDARLSFSELSIEARGSATITASTGAMERGIDIEEHELAFPLGSLAAGIAETVLPGAHEAVDLPALVASTLDCGDVASRLTDEGADAGCDAECLATACMEASVHLASSISEALRSGDADLARLVVSGHALLRDAGGDLRAELLVSGQWLGQVAPSEAPVGGSFTGTRIEKDY